MNSEFDLTRDVAEKVLKRAMTPLREFIDSDRNDENVGDGEPVTLTVGQVREMNRDLGALGITLATRYSEQVEYQTTVGVLAAENTRLHIVVEALAELADRYRNENSKIIADLALARNTNDKLKETSKRGFSASTVI